MRYRFGPFTLDEEARELEREGVPVTLQPLALDLLSYLVRNANRVVGKEELLDTLWPDVMVADGSIQRAVSIVRAELRKGGCGNAIQTKPKIGYRFLMPEAKGASARESSGIQEAKIGDCLLERDRYLERLRQKVAQASDGRGSVVFVSGEAGIGKTALVSTFLEGISFEGIVARGYCDSLGTPRALGAAIELAEQLGVPLNLAEDETAIRDRLFASLLKRLREETNGTILLIEDVHWADGASLDFLRYLIRRIRECHTLLIVTYRDDEIGRNHPMRRVLGEVSGANVTHLRLERLSKEAIAAMAEAKQRDAGRLFALSAGNAFLACELLSAPTEEVPSTVKDSLLARLSRCSEAARLACEFVSISPCGLDLSLLEGLLDDIGPFDAVVDESVERGILVYERGLFEYRHELARLAVEESLPPAHAKRLHSSLLRHLENLGSDHARMVHHAIRAHNDEAVAMYAPVAGDRASQVGAHREAAAHYAAALRSGHRLSDTRRVELLERHAYESYLTSKIEDAIASQHEVLRLWRSLGDATAIGRSIRFLSRLYWFAGDKSKSELYARQAIAQLEKGERGDELAMAYSNRAQLAMLSTETETAVLYAEKALEIARVTGNKEIESHALNNCGSALFNSGDPQGESLLLQSLDIALEHDFHEHVGRAFTNLSSVSVVKNMPAARDYLDRGIAYCEERDLDSWTTYMRVYQSRFLLDRGEWNRAAEIASALMLDDISSNVVRIPALAVLGQIRARRGDPGVWEVLDEALQLALPTGELQRIGRVAAARAEAAWCDNDLEKMSREVEVGLDVAPDASEPWIVGELLFWKSLVTSVESIPENCPTPYRLGIQGKWAEAASAFREYERPFEEAFSMSRCGGKAFERAKTQLSSLGARGLLRKIGMLS